MNLHKMMAEDAVTARRLFVRLVETELHSRKVSIPPTLASGRSSALSRVLGGRPESCREEELREIIAIIWKNMGKRDEVMRLVNKFHPPPFYDRPPVRSKPLGYKNSKRCRRGKIRL
jgi:hypothetical protein